MPPPIVKTIRDQIYWEYAKLIADSAVHDRKNYAFVMHSFCKLRDGAMHPSSILRENKMQYLDEKKCAYCGATGDLEWEHIVPRVKIDLDTIDNHVLACRKCNASKGGRDPFEWYSDQFGKEGKYKIPRLVLGKYLKLIFEIHEKQGTLDSHGLHGDKKVDVYDLGVIFKKP